MNVRRGVYPSASYSSAEALKRRLILNSTMHLGLELNYKQNNPRYPQTIFMAACM